MKSASKMRLDECCEIVSGATPNTSVAGFWNGDICWATPKDLSELETPYISDTPRKLTPAGLAACSSVVLPQNSVLFSSRAPIGHVAINTIPMATNQGFKSFIPRKGMMHAEFLAWWLKANRNYLDSLGNGATFKELSKAVISQVEIPLPPLEEQKRIADILDKADAIRRKRQEALRLTDEFLRSVFLEMFGDPVTNPRGLPKIELGNLIKLKSGNSLVGKNMARDGKHPVYGGNGVNGYHEEFMFEERKIVLGRVGVYCGAVHYSQPKSWITDNALYVEQFKRHVEDLYLIEALRHANLNQYAGRAAQPLISGGRIYPVEILFPSHELQLRFTAIP